MRPPIQGDPRGGVDAFEGDRSHCRGKVVRTWGLASMVMGMEVFEASAKERMCYYLLF